MVTHAELKATLRNRYKESHWVLMEEVQNASGFEGTRSIDVVAFGLYASRGYEVHAFECKARRSDWLKELREPEKADEFVKMVDKFWIVAGKGVVQKEELPVHWGLMVVSPHGDGFRIRVSKQAIRAASPSAQLPPLPRPFVGAMLTRLNKEIEKYRKNSVPRSEISKELNERFAAGVKSGKRAAGSDSNKFENLLQQVEMFEKASGLHIAHYTGGIDLGKRVMLVQMLEAQGEWRGFMHRVKTLVRDLRDTSRTFEEHITKLEGERTNLLEEGVSE